MPCKTRNSQAAAGTEAFPLVIVSTSENPANGNNVLPVSSASSCSQPSPEFLATVVQAVKSALAAEQQAISSSETSPVFSAPFQVNIAALALPSYWVDKMMTFHWQTPLTIEPITEIIYMSV